MCENEESEIWMNEDVCFRGRRKKGPPSGF